MYGSVTSPIDKLSFDPELVYGLCYIVSGGIFQSAKYVLAKLITQARLPYGYVLAVACVLCIIVLVAKLKTQGAATPAYLHWGWLLLRGLCGGGKTVAGILAVLCGISVGCAAALSTLNVLTSSLLGVALLGDKLTLMHLVGALGTTCGVLLMTWHILDPHDRTSNMERLGYMFAIAGAILQSLQLVAARKLKDVEVEYQSCFAIFFTGVAILLVKLPLFPEADMLGNLSSHPLISLTYQAAVAVTLYLGSVMGSLGASKLPVSLSACTLIGARMIGGFMFDVVIFKARPMFQTLLGAVVMAGSAVAIASAYVQPAEKLCSPHPSPSALNRSSA